MKYNIDYTLAFEYGGHDIEEDYTLCIDTDIQDIIAYLFEEKYNVRYHPITYHLERGSKEFVREIEAAWMANKIDFLDYYDNNYTFSEWIKDKYEAYAIEEFINNELDPFLDTHLDDDED